MKTEPLTSRWKLRFWTTKQIIIVSGLLGTKFSEIIHTRRKLCSDCKDLTLFFTNFQLRRNNAFLFLSFILKSFLHNTILTWFSEGKKYKVLARKKKLTVEWKAAWRGMGQQSLFFCHPIVWKFPLFLWFLE